MDVTELRHYGAAFSEAESAWPPDVIQRMRVKAKAVLMVHLGPWQKVRLLFAFFWAQRSARALDLTDLRERGMTNDRFLDQQLEYLAMFSALAGILGTERAVEVMEKVMDETAREPLLLCLPDPANVGRVGSDPLKVFRDYLRVAPSAAARAGCHALEISEDSADAFQFDVRWCVWLELAERMGVPEGCLPNCYSDDLVFPEYFEQFGITYRRTQTLAGGGSCCDFRFERKEPSIPNTRQSRTAHGARRSGAG
jgi:hypothetical protein